MQISESAASLQSGLKPFIGAFSQGPEQRLLDCPGLVSQNRKQQGKLQFVTSAACFTVLCSSQTTEDGVVTQPELWLDNTCIEGNFTVIFFMPG